jgi:hypothetical protein
MQFSVVDEQCESVLAFSKSFDMKYMGTYQALLYLTSILSVNKQTTAPHHSLKQ